jgi:predicted kinase
MILYHWSGATHRMEIRARDEANEIIATLEDVSMEMSHLISRALDRVHEDGLRTGKLAVINAVNRATDAITV